MFQTPTPRVRVLSALLVTLCLLGALPAVAESVNLPAVAISVESAPPAEVDATAPDGLADLLAPAPEFLVTGSALCQAITDSFCVYKWTRTGCCVATYTAPGALCAPVCI